MPPPRRWTTEPMLGLRYDTPEGWASRALEEPGALLLDHLFCEQKAAAMAMAIAALNRKEVSRVILTRPAVEAGERLGFLPGDLTEKVDPYMRPLYDALHDMMDFEKIGRLSQRGVIEVAPLAFMRGRTLNDSFVILDEAQNTTPEQMKMFLTRVGFGSRVVVTGDVSQVDVPGGRSGLEGLQNTLSGIEGLSFIRLGARDVVRHRIVQDIVEAYERTGVKPVSYTHLTLPTNREV